MLWGTKRRITMGKNVNPSALPEHCYAVLPNSGQLIEVRHGEKDIMRKPDSEL